VFDDDCTAAPRHAERDSTDGIRPIHGALTVKRNDKPLRHDRQVVVVRDVLGPIVAGVLGGD
jgi:hypothetical protein